MAANLDLKNKVRLVARSDKWFRVFFGIIHMFDEFLGESKTRTNMANDYQQNAAVVIANVKYWPGSEKTSIFSHSN